MPTNQKSVTRSESNIYLHGAGPAWRKKAESQLFGLTFFAFVDYRDKTSNLIKDLNRLCLFALEVL